MNIPVTEWFPAEVRPVHVGVYEIYEAYCHERPTFKHWDGKEWGFCSRLAADARPAKHLGASVLQKCKWRGLASPHPEWKP